MWAFTIQITWICYNYNQFSCSLLAFRYRFLNEKNSDLVCHWLCASAFHSIPFRFDSIPCYVRPLPCTMWKLFALVTYISHSHSGEVAKNAYLNCNMYVARTVCAYDVSLKRKRKITETTHTKFKVIDNVNKEKENVHNLQIDAEMKKCGKAR